MKIVEKISGRRSRLNRRRAFTLIEMLAALALAMLLLYMLFQIFTTVGRAMTISNARSEIHANARAILRIIHQEISGAFLDTSRDADDDDNDGDPSSTTDPDHEVGDYFINGQIVDQSDPGPPRTADFSNGSTQVTGTNTNWQGLVGTGDYIRCDAASSDGLWYEIISVVSDTELSLAGPYGGPDAPGAEYTISQTLPLQFLTTSAVGADGVLSEVGYWLDPSDATLRRRLASDPTNYDSPPGTDYTSFDPSNRVLDMNNDGDFEASELPTTDAAEEATILGENVLAFNVEHYDAALLTDGIDNDGDGLTDSDDPDEAWVGDNYIYIAREKWLTPAVRITLRVRDSRGRLSEGEEFVEIIAIRGRE